MVLAPVLAFMVGLEDRFDPERDVALTVVSYNIKHGRGMDDRVDLERTGSALTKLGADIIGLQEVDKGAGRSGSVDQVSVLGRQLGMEGAFGAFMDFDGGEYGMGALSKFAIRGSEAFRLPEGNEPRVALMVDVTLPSGEVLKVVNVHFDWVGDDGFRFAQASRLVRRLRAEKGPYVLLGDFNDRPGSRTIEMFRTLVMEAVKPEGASFTFPSDGARQEIDFVFVSPPERWSVRKVEVVPDAVTSDHLAVRAELVLRSNGGSRR